MKIAVIGATGHAGSRIVDELVRRGHAADGVVNISRIAEAAAERKAELGTPQAVLDNAIS